MKEQNQPLHPDQEQSQPRLFPTGNKIIKRKLCQLQNKAHFFEGQINPLLNQNEKLKAQLTLLNKSVLLSTDLLRSLLPIGSSQNKRLKLQLASIDQICEMIKEDWYLMEDQISRKTFAIDVLQKKIISNQEQYETEFYNFKQQTERLIEERQMSIQMMLEKVQKAEDDLQKTKNSCKKQISQINEFFRVKVEKGQKLQKDLEIYRRQVNDRYSEYDRLTVRLKEQINCNLLQFEEGKRNLREIYEKLMSDKMEQQEEGFNVLLRNKEEEKERLVSYFQEKEEELQTHLNQKCETISKLELICRDQKEEIHKRQETIYECKEKISLLHSEITTNFSQINLLKKANLDVQNELKKVQKRLSHNQLSYKTQIEKQTNLYTQSENQLTQQIKKLQKTSSQLNEEIQDKSQKLKLTEKSLVTIERRYKRKLQQQQQKWTVQKLSLQQQSKKLQNTLKQKQALIQQKLNLIAEQEKVHSEQILKQEERRRNELQEMKANHDKEMELWREESVQKFELMKKDNDRLLREERIKNNQQMQKFMIEFNMKLTTKQEEFNFIKNNLHQELKQRNLELQKLSLQYFEAQKRIEKINSQHLLEVTKMKKDAQKKLEDLQKLNEEQKRIIQQQMIHQMMEFQAEMSKKQSEYENTLKKIQTDMMNQINMLKSSNALEQMESKFLTQMETLRQQHETQINTMEQKQKSSQQHLIDEQNRRIQQLIAQYEEDMTRLAKKLQTDIQKLNGELFVEQNEHEITKMTRQDKITYLSKKINGLKLLSEQKENCILQLQLEIQGYKREQERIKEIIEEKVNQRKTQLEKQKNDFLQECQASVVKTKQQAQKKINQAQKDRLQHTQHMYQKFNQLREFHEQQMNRLQRKYSELQKLFSQRPSRAEDLSKIKELIQIKEKMNFQITACNKKVQHANQIVKYLNLELGNYKDNYDIFGRGEQLEGRPAFAQNPVENPAQSIIKLRKINQRLNTEGTDLYPSQRKQEILSPTIMNPRTHNDSPSINDFQIFPQKTMNDSQTLLPASDTAQQSKWSSNKRSPDLRGKINKGKNEDKSGEIMLNAENFLKLIRSNSKSNSPLYKEFKSKDKKAYRKSKPRRLNTLGMGSGEMYTLARRGSMHQEQYQ